MEKRNKLVKEIINLVNVENENKTRLYLENMLKLIIFHKLTYVTQRRLLPLIEKINENRVGAAIS